MTNRPLGKCPTCLRSLDAETLRHMGLRSGETLNEMLPGLIGPTDIDHLVHNGWTPENRVQIFEYKPGREQPSEGQQRALDALRGDWREVNDDRSLSIRYVILPAHPRDEKEALRPAVQWLWPE